MEGNIKHYLLGIASCLPPEIVSGEAYGGLYKITELFRDFAASEYILESRLDDDLARVDYSLRVLDREKGCLKKGLAASRLSALTAGGNWKRILGFINHWSECIDDIWLEMDSEEIGKQTPQPCFFFNAGRVKTGNVIDYKLLFDALEYLFDNEQVELIKYRIKYAVEKLPYETGLFQIGAMLARNRDRVRIFTGELSRDKVQGYLEGIGWPGSFACLDKLFLLAHQYSDGLYILDFDVSSQGVSEKIGVNFGLKNKAYLAGFLDNLAEHGLCAGIKKRGVLSWPGSRGSYLGKDYGYAALIRDISHFKISSSPEEGLKAKAYLRVHGVYLKDMFRLKQPGSVQAPKNGNTDQPAYKEMQNVFKEIARRSMLDEKFRELCLRDGMAAIKEVTGGDAAVPGGTVFLEEDGVAVGRDAFVFVLPPFLKKSWLTGK